MKEKWVCKKCGAVRLEKPYKNETCECSGRFVKYSACKSCGTMFANSKGKTYCSSKCKEAQRHTVELVCDNCGKNFVRYASDIKSENHNFCCKKCMIDYMRGETVTSECEQCGKEFTIYKSLLRTNAAGKFCSRECYHESMKKPKKGYSGFRQAKRRYFSGVQHCALCGSTDGINIHHIIPNRLTQDNGPDNLIPLCRKHHMPVEALTRKVLETEGDLVTAKFMLNNILRTYQLATYAAIAERI